MLPYYVMVGVPAIFALYLSKIRGTARTKNKIVIDAFFLIWMILLCLRSEEVGTDLDIYKYHFMNYPRLSWRNIFSGILSGQFEAGYVLLSKLMSYVTSNFRWVIVSTAGISVIPLWKLYREEENAGFLSVVMFLNIASFPMYFSGLRQAMAMAFMVPCYRFCKEKRLWKFLPMVFLAFLFHRSALILLLMYPVYHARLKKQIHILYLLPLIGVVYYFKIPIFRFLFMFMEGTYGDYSAGIHATGAYSVLLLLVVLLIYAFFVPEQQKMDEETVGLRNLMILSVLFQTFAGAHSIAMRMNYYYLPLIPLLIARVVERSKMRYESLIKVSVISMVLFFTIYYFYKAYTGTDILQIYPYYPLWHKTI